MTGYRQIYNERVLILTTEKYVKLTCYTLYGTFKGLVLTRAFIIRRLLYFRVVFFPSRCFGGNRAEAVTHVAQYDGKLSNSQTLRRIWRLFAGSG